MEPPEPSGKRIMIHARRGKNKRHLSGEPTMIKKRGIEVTPGSNLACERDKEATTPRQLGKGGSRPTPPQETPILERRLS